jgi:hypothetical protein
MKKVLATLFILAILSGSVVGNKASASIDEMPKLTRAFNVSIYDVNHLK